MNILAYLSRQADVVMAIGVIGLVAMMVIPLPPVLLDVLLTLNIGSALCILLVSMYVRKPLDFSVFPSLLLVATLFRLALNVSSTRLILLNGSAGKVIEAFGQFVVGGDIIVGLILFLILVVIQFVVITNGSQRVAEVAARFTLDEMPGKQMSIDSDLNAGIIGQEEAKGRRRDIEREADFYGAMDGASKFVRGDAIAGIIIVCINIIGGIVIGSVRMHMPVAEALRHYALLTVGDGLVSQLPALLISTATGMVVTRAASEENLGVEVGEQMTGQPRALMIVGLVLIAFSAVPGLPTGVFVVVGGSTATLAWYLLRQAKLVPAIEETHGEASPDEASPPDDIMHVDRVSIQLGYGLLMLTDPQSGDLMDRIAGVRRQIAGELGVLVPPVRVRDEVGLDTQEYRITIKEARVGQGALRPALLMALNPTPEPPAMPGEDTVEPAFGLPAKWIRPEDRALAEARGYTVVDPSTVLATHLGEVCRRRAGDLLSRQDVQDMIDALRDREPAAVNDVIPDLASVGQVQQVLRELLSEGVPIRDFATILEALADGLRATQNLPDATEVCRLALSRIITNRYTTQDGKLHALTLHPEIEKRCLESSVQTTQGLVCGLEAGYAMQILKQVRDLVEAGMRQALQPILLVSPQVRRIVHQFIERDFPGVPVVSHAEIPADAAVEILGSVNVEQSANAA